MSQPAPIRDRFRHHPPSTPKVAATHDHVRETTGALAELYESILPPSPEATLAIRALETAMHWANAAVAIYQHEPAGIQEAREVTGQLTSYLLTEPKSCSRRHDCSRAPAVDTPGRDMPCNGVPRLPRPQPARPQAGQ